MRIVIAPDKFKGCLSALEVAEALREGFVGVWPSATVECIPIADGGEGTAEVLCRALNAEWVEAHGRDPLGRPVTGRFASNGRVAALEMSAVSGLRLLASEERDPKRANTRGTGEMLLAAIGRGAECVIVGLGGSATNDGGIGMASALGYRFFDATGQELSPEPRNLGRVERIERPTDLCLPEVLAAVDVRNPLLGVRGATRVYGPQKGADAEIVEELERGMAHFSEVVQRELGLAEREAPGDGAAGGLGFGLRAFCNAEIRNGFALVADAANLEDRIAGCDLVATAEGALDGQTLEGKAPAGVAEIARRQGKPVVAFAGTLHEDPRLEEAFDALCPIAAGPMTLKHSIEEARPLLTAAARRFGQATMIGSRLSSIQ